MLTRAETEMPKPYKRIANPEPAPTATTVVVRDYFPVSVPIDDVTGAATIPLRIRRFNRAQMEAFQTGWAEMSDPPSARVVYRLQAADEQQQDDKGSFIIPDGEIARRRLAELTPEQRAARDAQEQTEFAATVAFCIEQITAHVWVAPVNEHGIAVHVEREAEDGSKLPVRTGADVAALFANNGHMLGRIVRQIHDENNLSPEKKRLSKLFSASLASSLEQQMAAVGPSPAATADAAAPAASAATARASGRRAPIRFGRTDR